MQTVYWEVVSLLFNQRFLKKHPYRKHEWEKHGTCAAQLEALNSQKKYFGKSLDLSKELALNRWVTWSCSLAFLAPLSQVTPTLEQHPCLRCWGPGEAASGVVPEKQPLPP